MDGEKINGEDAKKVTSTRFMKECTVEVVLEKRYQSRGTYRVHIDGTSRRRNSGMCT